jgi:SecD/SecF fusion protein
MSFLGATFTLPGIAGIILTLGMAVDANVLIFERMREELQRGVSARMAVKLGYEKAFTAIFDSNLTTIITAAILFWIGSEEIKGFGLTLGLGLCISMFTALFVTRQYYYIMVPTTLNQQETRKAWVMTGLLALVGGAAFAVGWLFNRTPDARADSTLLGFGKFVLVLFGTAAFLMCSMWAFRFVYRASGHQKANRLPMMKLMSAPNIDWMSKYKIFWTISACIIAAGYVLIWVGLRDAKLLDIEFVGGTSVTIQLKDDANLPGARSRWDEEVRKLVAGGASERSAADWLLDAAGQLERAKVEPRERSAFLVEVPGNLTFSQVRALLLPVFEKLIARNGLSPEENGVLVQIDREDVEAAKLDAAGMAAKMKDAARNARSAANKLQAARVQLVTEELPGGGERKGFEIVTTETSRPVVTEAILAVMGNLLEIKRPVEATLVKDDKTQDGVYPIGQDANVLADVIGGNWQQSVSTDRGGAVIVFDNLTPPQSKAQIEERLKDASTLTEFAGIGGRVRTVVPLASAAEASSGTPLYKSVAIITNDPNIPYYDLPRQWKTDVADKELSLAQTALSSTQSLQRVTQFAAQVAGEATQKAVIAIVLSLLAIAAYLWVRFGSAQFGLAGILALYHDVSVALACVVASHYLYNTWFGHLIGLRDFKIDLNIIAALLTIIGFSINDSIVIFDRIRENRGRLATLSPRLLNDSINQTLSRTILTVVTVLMVVLVMYIWGGEGIKGFAFTMLIGTIVGSYSTFAIAVPMVQHEKAMWLVTIVITAITLIGMIAMMTVNPVTQTVLIVIVAALAVAAAVRYLLTTRGEPALARQAKPAPAGFPVGQA